MDNKGKEKGNTNPKKIFDAISSANQELLIKFHSANLFYSKNILLNPQEKVKNDYTQENDVNKEYKIGNYMIKLTLGQGKFAKVKLGIYLPNNQKVAKY
jgi:hypothetical protein